MRGLQAAATAVAAFSFFPTLVSAQVDPIVIRGSKFFYKTNGTEFFIKGVAYQQDYNGNGSDTSTSYTDPLADVSSCQRDVPLLQQLQTNTIRVYAVDPTKDHSQCMQMLQNAGIYVISDLSDPATSINRDDPEWNDDLYVRYASVIDAFANYTNVIGFFAGNEVANAPNNTQATPFVKAAVRDMKAYIKQKNYRPMGVGYATSDDASIREQVADYFNCGPSADSADFYGYNIYSWCDPSTYQQSGYADRTQDFQNYTVPVFFAEYGCNTGTRTFQEVQALYGSQMSPVWSGGIVYMYFEEANNYGLVSVSGSSASKLPDFTALSSQIANVTPSAVNSGSYSPTNTQARSCPPTGDSWNASSNLPPTPNQQLCSCMVANLSCIANPNINAKAISSLFAEVCGLDNSACHGVAADGSSGKYGALSMCNATEQLSWAFNAYFQSQGGASTACSFGGNATIQNPATPQGACSALLAQVGPAGTGTVTSQPTAPISTAGSTASSTSSKKPSAGGALIVPSLDFGVLTMGAYLLGALLAGAGMVLL